MNIVKIWGGLGNQMFQYAFFQALKNKNYPIKLDVKAFKTYTLHQGYELTDLFSIPDDEFCSTDEINALKDINPHFFFRISFGKLIFSDPNRFVKDTHLIEINYSKYEQDYLKRENTYLDGYWQSEKYFSDIESQIRGIYKWKNVNKKNLATANVMLSENSVAIHIRRFDRPKNLKEIYMQFKLLLVWRVCSKKYYLQALKYLSKTLVNPKYYIFTDNLSWVKKNIPLRDDCVVVDWNRNKDSHYDMFLMTQCKHNIISMSSFSWWGAWLNQNPNKIVIAPKKWALRYTKDIDLIPLEWKRL